MLNEIKSNYINENIKYIVVIFDVNQCDPEKKDEIKFLINTISTVPFPNKENAVSYIDDLKGMNLQGLLVKVGHTLEEDILSTIDEVRNENK